MAEAKTLAWVVVVTDAAEMDAVHTAGVAADAVGSGSSTMES
jgi:hypothetical protein